MALAWITQYGRHSWVYLVLVLAIPFVANLGLGLALLWTDTLNKAPGSCSGSLFLAIFAAGDPDAESSTSDG